MVRSARLERATVRLEGGCSIQLSYERNSCTISHGSVQCARRFAGPEHGRVRVENLQRAELAGYCRGCIYAPIFTAIQAPEGWRIQDASRFPLWPSIRLIESWGRLGTPDALDSFQLKNGFVTGVRTAQRSVRHLPPAQEHSNLTQLCRDCLFQLQSIGGERSYSL
jgi:hypothetical protein